MATVEPLKCEELKAPEEAPKGEPMVEPMVVVVAETAQNDSSEGLARMYADLEPKANRLKSAAASLLCISFLFCGSIEGLFGLVAGMSVLCCAAPGSLGTAYAARCTRICAIVCAAFALGHLLVLSTFAVVVPHVPDSINRYCQDYTAPPPAAIAADGQANILAPPPTDKPETGSMLPASRAESADVVVVFVAKAARRLQAAATEVAPAVAPEYTADEQCEQAAIFANRVLPYLIFLAAVGELCLFTLAMTVSRRAVDLIRAARSYGANAL